MAREQIVNNAVTYLASAISSVATSIAVSDASAFPASGDFVIIVDDEIILVESVSGDTFTSCVRGYEGTSNVGHDDGSVVAHILTAGSLLRHIQNDVPLFNNASVPLSNHLVDAAGTVLTASSFTPINQGDSTLTDDGSGGLFLAVPETADPVHARLYKKSAPTPPYTLTVQISRWMLCHTQFTEAGHVGIGFRESSSGKLALIGLQGRLYVSSQLWNGPTSVNSTLADDRVWVSGSFWVQIEDEGGEGDLIFRYGIDGVHWFDMVSVDRDTFMDAGPGPDEIFLYCSTWSQADTTEYAVVSTWLEEE